MRTTSMFSISILISLSAGLASRPVAACTKDSECKGDRICEEGRCTAPSTFPAEPAPRLEAAPRPAPRLEAPAPGSASGLEAQGSGPAQQPAPSAQQADLETIRRVVALHAQLTAQRRRRETVIGGYVATFFRHDHSAFSDLKGIPGHSGMHLGGYRAFTNKFHLGGYFAYASVQETHLLSTGISLKAGSWIKDRVWLGLAFDHGIEFTPQSRGFVLMQLSPRLHLDALMLKTPSFSLAASLAAGPTFLVNGDLSGGVQTLMLGLVLGR